MTALRLSNAWRRRIRSALLRFPAAQELRHDLRRAQLKVLRRPHDPDFEVLKALTLAPGEQILDIGANRGQSVDSMRLFQPKAEMHCFEANPLLAEKLKRRRMAKTTVHAFGLSDADGEFTLHVPFYRGWMFDGLASVDETAARDWLGPRTIDGFDPAHLRMQAHACRLRPLDALNLAPAFIKIDVQGHEAAVVEGAADTLRRCEPILMIEHDGEAAAARLEAMGFVEHSYEGGALRRTTKRRSNSFHLTVQGADRLRAGGLEVAA
ncbi:MAG: FkbM family methyltransferase [Pseudomonadota bacterium]